jgi:multiple sugar transport system permease protein
MIKNFWENLSLNQKLAITAWVFLAVPIIFYTTIRFYPTFEAFHVSFMKWNLLGSQKYVGLKNYYRIFGDEDFWIVLWNTIKYAVIGVPISLFISFTVAYYLNEIKFGHQTIRAFYFIPFLTTAVAMAWVWRWFYQPMPIGYFNIMLSWVDIPQQPFLRSMEQALYSVMAPAVWAGLGFQIVIFIAGIRAIPKSYFEAAEIDGAGRLQTLREIILPSLKPTTVFLVVISTIGFLRIFDQVYTMSEDSAGGPLNATKPLVLMIYDYAFDNYMLGRASALTVILFMSNNISIMF